MRIFVYLALIGFSLSGQTAQEIVRKSVERDAINFDRLKDYTYRERSEEKRLDGNGSVKSTEIRTRDVTILYGRPFSRLIAKNDKPLSPAEERKEQERFDKAVEQYKRDSADSHKQKEFEKRRAEGRAFLRRIPDAFNFTLIGEETIGGFKTWVLNAEPNPNYSPRNLPEKILARARGKIWIEQSGYEWVKTEALLTQSVSVGLFLAKLGEGAQIAFQQDRVNGEIWAPKAIHLKAEARLGFNKVRTDVTVTYSDYRKFQTDSKIVATSQP